VSECSQRGRQGGSTAGGTSDRRAVGVGDAGRASQVGETKPGWQRVLLPSRPNHTAGWIATGNGKLQTAHSPNVVKVDTSTRRLTLLKSGQKLGTWTVAVGAAKTPRPTGRTFVLASLAPSKATYSPLILPVGAHSETLGTPVLITG
jgi:hypothetical protein